MFIYRTPQKYIVYSKADIEQAYSVCYGHRPNSVEYIKFLNNIWGKGIYSAENLSCYDLVAEGYKILATRCYREENGCTLTEAKHKMDEYEEFLKNPIT